LAEKRPIAFDIHSPNIVEPVENETDRASNTLESMPYRLLGSVDPAGASWPTS
jgi:hypothetical protein